MAFVSVDIELMSRLVAELAAAEEAMTWAAWSLRADLASVGLSCDLLPRFLVGGYSVGEVRQIRLQCQQRLDKAIAIRDARSWLGWWGGNPVLPSVVKFDESVMSGENAVLAAELVKDIIGGRIHVEDGSPVEVNDPMYGVWSAAAYSPGWFLDTYQGHDLVDVVYGRAGYYGSDFMDGSDFDHMIPTHGDVDSALQELFTKRGFDQGSLNAFVMAASIANTWQSLTTETPTVATQVDRLFDVLAYERAEWVDLPWWDKYHHEILAAFSAVAGIAAMFVPGPGWVAGGLLLASVAAGAADVGLYIAEGEYWSAAITGVFLIPIAIGGTMRLIQLSRAELQALRTGRVIEVAGEHLGVVEGKVTQITATKWESLTKGGCPSWPFSAVTTRRGGYCWRARCMDAEEDVQHKERASGWCAISRTHHWSPLGGWGQDGIPSALRSWESYQEPLCGF